MNDNIFGNRLKELRLEAGLTQAQLADKLNISSSTIGMYEQGRREPDNDTLTKLCAELNTSVDYLLGIKKYAKFNNLDVDNVISDFIQFIENKENLMFNGQPIDKTDRKHIANAQKLASKLSIRDIEQNNSEN